MRTSSDVNEAFDFYKEDPRARLSGCKENEWSKLDALREKAAVEAFELRDWLIACECGGIKAEPHVQSHEAVHFDDCSIVKISYTLSSTCGCSDGLYHTGYKESDVYSDVYKVDNNAGITCLAGEEGSGSVGAQDVFHVFTKTITNLDPLEVTEAFEALPDDKGHVLEFKSRYSKLFETELDGLFQQEQEM